MHGFGRAIGSLNHLDLKMIMSLTFFGSRAPHARSAQKCVFYYISDLKTTVLRLVSLITLMNFQNSNLLYVRPAPVVRKNVIFETSVA